MRKLRWAWVLPLIQFVTATILLRWGYRAPGPRGAEYYVPIGHRICWGLNAPAVSFRILGSYLIRSKQPSGSVILRDFGFGADDLLFLAGVVIVWYLVGRALDGQRTSRTSGGHGIALALMARLLLLALGCLFLFVVFERYNHLDHAGAFLTATWSVSLIVLSGRWFVRLGFQSLRGSGRREDGRPTAP